MRKMFTVISLLMLLVAAEALGAVPTQILWDYDFTQPNSRMCTSAITTTCVTSFTVSIVAQPGFTVVSGPVIIPLPNTSSTTGPTVGIAAPFGASLPLPTAMGNYQIWVAVNYKDASGAVQQGPISSLGFAVLPVAAQNLRTQ